MPPEGGSDLFGNVFFAEKLFEATHVFGKGEEVGENLQSFRNNGPGGGIAEERPFQKKGVGGRVVISDTAAMGIGVGEDRGSLGLDMSILRFS